MMTELRIHNFRTFRQLTVQGLTRVSLLVGTNNSGKTSVLDAAELLLSRDVQSAIARSALRRGETTFIPEGSGSSQPHVELSHFFHGHLFRPDTSFSIEGDDDAKRYLSCRIVTLEEAEELQRIIPLPSTVRHIWRDWKSAALALTIKSTHRGDETPLLYTNTEGLAPSHLLRTGLAPEGNGGVWPVNFVGTAPLSGALLNTLWDRVVLEPAEAHVTESLRIIESDIERLAALSVPGVGSEGRMFVKLKGSEQRIPLGSMGEGIKRLLVLSLNLATCEDGYLLIDEIDTGLHHSVMIKMWHLVVETAKRLNAQVLATTHSLDCVHALAELYEQYPEMRDDISLHRIERGAETSIRHSADELLAAARHQMEVR